LALAPSFVLLFLQVAPLVFILMNADALPAGLRFLVGSLHQSATTTVGPALILITATSLCNVTMARDRFGGSLEGTLATPLTTGGLWIGKALFHWAIGGAFYLSMCLILWGLLILLPASAPDFASMSPGAFAGQAALLLVTTLLLFALIVLVQLGATAFVSVLATAVPIIGLWFFSYYLVSGAFKGSGILVDPAVFLRGELAAIPALLVVTAVVGPKLLRREAILMKAR
jgi:hypothetical protein